MKLKPIQDNDADVKSVEVTNSNVPGASGVSSADARENGASRNMTKFTVRFHWFSGSRSGCTYTGEVSVVAKTEEAAEAIVREDFSASFTDVVIAGVEKVEEFKDFFDDDAHGAVVEVEASEEKGRFCDVFVSAKGKNLEYNRIWGLMEAESEEDAKKLALEDFETPFDLSMAQIYVEGKKMPKNRQ